MISALTFWKLCFWSKSWVSFGAEVQVLAVSLCLVYFHHQYVINESSLLTIYSSKQGKQILSLQISCQCLYNSHSCSAMIGIWCQMHGFLKQTAFWQERGRSGSSKPVYAKVAMLTSSITWADLLSRSREARHQLLLIDESRDGKCLHL